MTHPLSRTILSAFVFMAIALITPSSRADDQEIPFAESPAAVQKTIRDENKGADIEMLTRVSDDGVLSYWAELQIGGKVYDLGVAENGTLKELSLRLYDDDDVSYSEAPEPVRRTFREESRGASIDTLTRDRQLGLAIYVAEVSVAGKSYSIKVAENGTLIEKTLVIVEDDVPLSDCPASVQKTLRDTSTGGTLGDIRRSAGIVKRVYSANLSANGSKFVIEVSEDGTLLGKVLDEG